MKPSVDKPEIFPTEQIPTVGEKMNTPEKKKILEQSQASSPTVRSVRKGDNLFSCTIGEG
jgi:hypothetical protein